MANNTSNSFFGVKVSLPGFNVNNASDTELLYKNDYSTETYYDSQGNPVVQLGSLANGAYGLQTATSGSDGNIVYGAFTSFVTGETAYGLQMTDTNGDVIFEMNGQTWYWFDPNNGYVNNMQVGKLPDGTYGWAVATTGNSVADAYS